MYKNKRFRNEGKEEVRNGNGKINSKFESKLCQSLNFLKFGLEKTVTLGYFHFIEI